MSKRNRAPFVALVDLLAHHRPDVASAAISEGRVLVDGRVLTNPAARVRRDASVRVLQAPRLRGIRKLSHALDHFAVDVNGRVALDVGANVGGFTTALLERGARRVYAVDAGVGQLLGRLRADVRVVNLEGCNLGTLSRALVPDQVEVITIDVSYLSLSNAVPQLNVLDVAVAADLIALVKPTFELHRANLAATPSDVATAVNAASGGIARAGWTVVDTCTVPEPGRRGAREALIHACRQSGRRNT